MFENLEVEHGSLGSKSANVASIPEPVVKLIDAAWNHTQEHPDQFHKVTLSTEAEAKEFHVFAKAAAKQHTPVLDYRKLPRPAEQNKAIAYFTLRELTADTPRPGRKPAEATPAAPATPAASDEKTDEKTDGKK